MDVTDKNKDLTGEVNYFLRKGSIKDKSRIFLCERVRDTLLGLNKGKHHVLDKFVHR